ncbi:DUF3899 domain-containing protein [Sporosarcina siberiensis]|uniref:DUF3899 domain-containing protein n=1 Tax=Sporosarcina siberiensis TaxID=1365606 RepID=A0ABW4SMH1_9BACL
MRKVLLITLLMAPPVLFMTFMYSFKGNIIPLLDMLFYIGLLLSITSGILFILQEQFFNAFISNSKHFFSKISKQKQLIEQIEGKKEHRTTYKKHYPYLKYILVLGVFYCSFSLIASIAVVYLGR